MNLDFGPIIRKFIEVFMISSAFYMSPYIHIYMFHDGIKNQTLQKPYNFG
jgi:hypothetical protein